MPHRRSQKGKDHQWNRLENHVIKSKQTTGLPLYRCKPSKEIIKLTTCFVYMPNLRNRVVKAVGSCVLCGYSDVNALEVHHIDGRHKNDSWSNITVVCSNCHTLITKGKLNYWDELTQKNLKTNDAEITISTKKPNPSRIE